MRRRWIPGVLAFFLVASAEAVDTFGLGSAQSDVGGGVAVDANGNLFVAGGFGGTLDFDPGDAVAERTAAGTARLDAFVAKYDADGRFQWVVTFGSPDVDLARCVAVDGRGGVYVAGNFSGTVDFDPGDPESDDDTLSTGSGRDAFLARYGPDGKLVWVRGFGDEDHAPRGSRRSHVEWSEDGRDLAVDKNGNVYLAGIFSGVLDLDPGPALVERTSEAGSRDGFVVSLDPAGAYRWGAVLGGEDLDQCDAVAVGPHDMVVVGGGFGGTIDFDPGERTATATADGKMDAYLAWYDRDGQLQQHCTWGGYGIDHLSSGALVVDDRGYVYAGGEFKGKVDFAPGRKKRVPYNEGGVDAFFARFTPGAELDWVATIGAGGTDSLHALCLDAKGNVTVTGRFQKWVDFAPGPRKYYLGAKGKAGASYAFVATYTSKGRLIWARALGAKVRGVVKLTRGLALARRPDGDLVVLGTYFGELDVDPGRQTRLLPGFGEADIFVIRYDAQGNAKP